MWMWIKEGYGCCFIRILRTCMFYMRKRYTKHPSRLCKASPAPVHALQLLTAHQSFKAHECTITQLHYTTRHDYMTVRIAFVHCAANGFSFCPITTIEIITSIIGTAMLFCLMYLQSIYIHICTYYNVSYFFASAHNSFLFVEILH